MTKSTPTPITGRNERGPVERVSRLPSGSAGVQYGEVRLVHGISGIECLLQSTFIERTHPETGCIVLDRPEAHDDGADTSDLKRSAEAEHSFTRTHFPHPGVAGREHCPLYAREIESRHLFGRQDTVVLAAFR